MKKRGYFETTAAAVGLFVLIIDSRNALIGAGEGLNICIRVLIPTLFPFLFLSAWLCGRLEKISVPGGAMIARLFSVPKGAEPLLLCGLLGGYPTGALNVDEAVGRGLIAPKDGKRLLIICNQCGPAFIFGMTAVLFDSPLAGWLLLLIQLLSAMITAYLLPQSSGTAPGRILSGNRRHPMDQAIRSTANICGWVILFKTLVAFLQRWALWIFPVEAQVALVGLLEMSNGCLLLPEIGSSELRFMLCAAFMNFGGLCVTMQTFSLVKNTDKGLYLQGKLLQSAVAAALSCALCGRYIFAVPPVIGVVFSIILRKNKKRCRNSRRVVV